MVRLYAVAYAQLPAKLTFLDIKPEECLVVYRNVYVAALDDPDLPVGFICNQDKGMRPRRQELQHPILHTAVSCYTDPEANRRIAGMHPAIPQHIAQLVLPFGMGFRYMDPTQDFDPTHRRILGHPLEFACAVTDVFSVRE